MSPASRRALAALCRDGFLLARYAPPGRQGRPDGHAFERAVGTLPRRAGLTRLQGAGVCGVFGCGSASGAAHEIDGAGCAAHAGVWLEAKAHPLSKTDVAVFELKCSDLYIEQARRRPAQTAAGAWWPLLVSSEPASAPVRALCAARSIVLCDPGRLPLPVLAQAAAVPDRRLPADALRAVAPLLGSACRPLQQRWRISPDGSELTMTLAAAPSARAIAPGLAAQDALSAGLLDILDADAPGELERRAAGLAGGLWSRLRAA